MRSALIGTCTHYSGYEPVNWTPLQRVLLTSIALLALVWWATLPNSNEGQPKDEMTRKLDQGQTEEQTESLPAEPPECRVKLMALTQGPDGWESREAAVSDACLAARERLAR